MAGRGRRVRKAKIKFAETKNKVRAEVNRQQSYINQYWQFKGGDPKFAGWNEKSENHFFSGGPRAGTWTTGQGIQNKLTWRGNGLGFGGVDQKQFNYMSPDSAYNRITGQNQHYAKSQVRARSKKEYAKIAGELKDKALLSALGKLDTAKDSWNQIQNKDFDTSTVRSSRNFGASQKGLFYTDPTNYVSAVTAVLLDNKSKGITTPNVSKGGQAYRQEAVEFDDGRVGTVDYDDGQDYMNTYKQPEKIKPGTDKVNDLDIFGFDNKTGESSEGRDEYLKGIGVSSLFKPSWESGKLEMVSKSNKDIMAGMGATQKEDRTKVTELNKLKQKLKHAYANRTEHSGQDKVDKVKAEIKLKFPGMSISGNATDIGKKLTSKIDSISTKMSANKKKQDAMYTYVSLDRINTQDKHRGVEVGYQNKATQRAVDKAKAEAAQKAAQKAYDELWGSGGGASLLTDTSGAGIQSIGQANLKPLNSNGKSLVTKVGILKQYDSWDQRRKHIAPELDERKDDLNRYYNSNYLQDFTKSDKEASQSMFGIDTPTGHSLAYNSMTEIGINQKTPRTAIKSINQILSKTDTDRQDYAKSLSGIEEKLLTLKEQRELKRQQNKAVEADIARQVEADVSGGHVSVNTEFRDKITGTSEELYDLNVQVAEHNVLKDYYGKSISQTDEDVEHLKDRLVDVTKVKNRNDYDTITSSGGDDGGNRSRSSLGGYNKANRFRRSTGGKVQRTRGGRRNNLSGLVL